MNTYGIHSIHGRAPAVATGLKASRPDLSVWVITGDGDALSIGGKPPDARHSAESGHQHRAVQQPHFRLDQGTILADFALGQVTKSTPMGAIDNPLHPLSIAIGCEASFVARSIDVNIKHLTMILRPRGEHKGTSFVEVYQNCNVFNDGAWDYATDRETKGETVIELEHGQAADLRQEPRQGHPAQRHASRNRRAGQRHQRGRPAVPRRADPEAEPGLLAQPDAKPRFPGADRRLSGRRSALATKT